MLHKLSSNQFISQHDLDALLSDSIANSAQLKQLLDLLKLDGISDFMFFRITNNSCFYYAGTLHKSYVQEYYNLGNWINEGIYNPYEITNFSTIDYNDPDYQASPNLLKLTANKISIFLNRRHQLYKDMFCFDINKERYDSLNLNDILKLNERLNAIANLCYTSIKLSKLIQFPIVFTHPDNALLKQTNKEILDHYNLSETNIAYLSHIASGCTAKEIASHMDKSYRSVQDVIQKLCDKFNLSSKSQLEQIAKIIFSYFK
ncbi:LuxR C-terminal-related transcriptional regulator [Francisellaceae bacterium]|nr:LuxR C-terminal-related transcriptional regulator [Francisellaceae bacterium]